MRRCLSQRGEFALSVVVERADAEVPGRSGAQASDGVVGAVAREGHDVQNDVTKVVQLFSLVVHVQPVTGNLRAVTIGPGPGQLDLA